MKYPANDGDVTEYQAVTPPNRTPRIYYVNGMQTDAKTHAQSCTCLSILTERVVHGVFNATGGAGLGFLVDLLQCGDDWLNVFRAKLGEKSVGAINDTINGLNTFVRQKVGYPPANPVNVAEEIRRHIPEQERLRFVEKYITNKPTKSLFRELRANRDHRHIFIAHSQGILITADALWAMSVAYGESSLGNMQVFSLASPTPAWPLGIRYKRKVYGHTNDLVTLCDPHNWDFIMKRLADGMFSRTAGDWRQHGTSWVPGLAGHDINRNIALNFSTTLRRELGLPPLTKALPKI
jgi:hypothetical protein